jgi:hypothetical protein
VDTDRREEKQMEGLRFPAMVLGIIGGVGVFIAGILDMIVGNLAGGLVALLGCIALLAISAMMPSLPGWSSVLFALAAFVFLMTSSVAIGLSAPLLLIAAVLGTLASRAKRRASAARVT